jgi:hypothetical protein
MSADPSRLSEVIATWAKDGLRPLESMGIPLQAVVDGIVQEFEGVGRTDASGVIHLPDQLNLSLNALDASALAGVWPSLQKGLLNRLQDDLRKAGFGVPRRLHLSVATDPSLDPGQVQMIAWHSGDPLGVEAPDPARQPAAEPGYPEAFLVVGGSQRFNLKTDETKIGRRMDNDLVLDNPRVSRTHAVILRSGGHFAIHDLDSTAGTVVNGRRIESAELAPGDVIQLADIELVYGERPGEPPAQAPDYVPPSPSLGQPLTEFLTEGARSDPPPTSQPPPTSPRPSN